jgi:menaquinone-dependent protoporphyrinogen oxidase
MHILVTAASKHGATIDIARSVAEILRKDGHVVDVTEPERVLVVKSYDAVVLGSAVYTGHWLDPALGFVERFSDRLQERPVWLFSSGPVGDPPKPDEEPVDVAEVMATTGARGHMLFAGKLDRHNLGFGERAIAIALRAPQGDFRDWNDIEAWARDIATELRNLPVGAGPQH